MRWLCPILLIAVCAAFAASQRLYLKDGNYHVVREYQVLDDRVRYYSAERGDWEEIPLELVDLDRTRKEVARREESLADERQRQAEEAKFDRQRRAEVRKIPDAPGVYFMAGDELITLGKAETLVKDRKRRNILKVITPIPVVTGKSTIELAGEAAARKISAERPEFYILLSEEQDFGIIRLKKGKGIRVVEEVTIMPVTNEYVEEMEHVEIFRQQVGDSLYKIWPQEPLTAGEYAVVEFTQGKANTQVWDFSYQPAAP
ncbi:MAG: hypothetical protein IPM24_21780 [Bryobacterales bacterium]|nr:hypothetical protein [Bryobacterales bacterium]